MKSENRHSEDMKMNLQQKIQKKIKDFDLYSLIKLLESAGYSHKDMYFESNLNQVSYSSLCESITFFKETPQVRITLNMGLLGSASPLPSFFRKYIDSEEVNEEALIRFLNFFNHHLIHLFISTLVPEDNDQLFSSWKETQADYLSLLGVESISTLWFLIKICFPDLVIEVVKNPQVIQLNASSFILGKDGLGAHSYLGKRFNQTLSSFKVIFNTEEDFSELGVPWPIEINRRLVEWIFPLIKKSDLHLSIVLVIKHKYNYMQLGAKTYVGFDRLWKSSQPLQLLLFYGVIKDLQRNAYLAKGS